MDLSLLTFFSVLGILWTTWMALTIFKRLLAGLKAYFWPYFGPQIDLVTAYGSWAVVTGSSEGIGLAYAKELAKRKVNVVLMSRRLEKLQKVAAEIETEHEVKTKVIEVDFSKGESVYKHIKHELRDIPVGILVNNVAASTSSLKYVTEMSEKELWDTVVVNCGATVQMTRMVLPQMQKRRKGAIVNISSGMEDIAVPLVAVYAASKVFIRNFAEAVRSENQKYGIFVQTLAPHVILTERTQIIRPLKSFQRLKFLAGAPDQYARHAIRTLGVVEHTAGFYIHGFLQFVYSGIPVSWLQDNFYRLRKEVNLRTKILQNTNANNPKGPISLS